MSAMTIETPSHELVAVASANLTATSFTTLVPKTATPNVTVTAGSGVVALGVGGATASSALLVVPYGVGSDGNTFSMSVYGWNFVRHRTVNGGAALWVPVLLCTFTACTLESTLPGVAGTELGATQLFCSTMTLGVGNSGTSVEVVAPGASANQIAHALIDAKGFRFVEFAFNTGSSATSCNALVARM
jgi:hypothetical protein